ncbi:MAG: 2-hydroxyacid dehydrogenase [Peptococcaceae bacterium]
MKALVTAELDQNFLPRLAQLCELTIAGWGKEQRKLREEELIDLMQGREILITSYDEITREVIKKSKDLKLIICTRSNPVNIDIAAADSRKIPVVYTPGRNDDCVSEFTLALIMNVARKIPMAYQSLKAGKFLAADKVSTETKQGLQEDITWALNKESPYVVFKGVQLKNKILGLIGYGTIGRKVAHLARAFGMQIYVYDPYVPETEIEADFREKVSLAKLLQEADFISCHCKVTPETRGMMGAKEFKMMKKTSYFINTSRGAIVNEAALIQALKTQEIAGAALDVYASEPLHKKHPFIAELENVVITPHLGGASHEVITNHTLMTIDELQRFLKGENLQYRYN